MRKFFGTLINYEIEVVNSSNENYIGIRGKVLDETKNMLIIKSPKGKILKIIKRGSVFKIKVNENEEFVIKGNKLVGNIVKRVVEI